MPNLDFYRLKEHISLPFQPYIICLLSILFNQNKLLPHSVTDLSARYP